MGVSTIVPQWLAEQVSFWSGWVLVGALVVGVIATGASIISANVKEDYWAADREAAAERIAANEAETGRAKESAAQADAKTAELQREAAELRLALEREIALREPRSINETQRAAMFAVLKDAPKGLILINAKWMDTEAERFGGEVRSVFADAGYTVADPEPKILSFGILGVFVAIKDASNPPPHFNAVVAALEAAGFQVGRYAEGYVSSSDAVFIGISAKP